MSFSLPHTLDQTTQNYCIPLGQRHEFNKHAVNSTRMQCFATRRTTKKNRQENILVNPYHSLVVDTWYCVMRFQKQFEPFWCFWIGLIFGGMVRIQYSRISWRKEEKNSSDILTFVVLRPPALISGRAQPFHLPAELTRKYEKNRHDLFFIQMHTVAHVYSERQGGEKSRKALSCSPARFKSWHAQLGAYRGLYKKPTIHPGANRGVDIKAPADSRGLWDIRGNDPYADRHSSLETASHPDKRKYLHALSCQRNHPVINRSARGTDSLAWHECSRHAVFSQVCFN